jgi:arginine decarboxylase
MRSYSDLIHQTFYFPTEEFRVENGELFFNEVPLMEIIQQYGTPMKITYLPKISRNIQQAKSLFAKAIQKHNYQGQYTYCYCTKSSHFSFVVEEALKNNIHLETSSSFDMPIIKRLFERGKINKDTIIVCNGYKRERYSQYISEFLNEGFHNCIPVLDNMMEINYLEKHVNVPYKVGIRVAADEEPNFDFYTSRLGVRYNDVIPFYKEVISNSSKAKLKMLHYFINTGIKDTVYYWSELSKFVQMYCDLRKICPDLDTIDIGGGFPIKTSLHFDYNYEYMIDQIVFNIQEMCRENGVPEPHIITEFGSYTVGESGATIYSVIGQKLQNDKELWYMIDGSFITQLPDVWGLNQKFLMLAVNQWNNRFQKVNLGGLTCDSQDFYNSEAHTSEVYLPKIEDGQTLYMGMFHTGAYQETLGGFGGLQHCLIPAPQHIIINRDESGRISHEVFSTEQDSESMMQILGYSR